MLELSFKTKYALQMLAFLARQSAEKFYSLKIISQETGMPYRFLSSIATKLFKAQIIGSKEGKNGGYFLVKKLDDISLAKLIFAVDGPIGLVDCQVGKACGKECFCKSKKSWDELNQELFLVFKKYNVSDFI